MLKVRILINLIGAIVVFAIFAFHPFLSWMNDGSSFLMPFWVWGLAGVVIFEVAFFILIK